MEAAHAVRDKQSATSTGQTQRRTLFVPELEDEVRYTHWVLPSVAARFDVLVHKRPQLCMDHAVNKSQARLQSRQCTAANSHTAPHPHPSQGQTWKLVSFSMNSYPFRVMR